MKRWIGRILLILFALLVGVQSWWIAWVGVFNQIPQLTGDGGGGVLLAFWLLLGSLLSLKWRWPVIVCCLLASIDGVLCGQIYQDNMQYVYAAGALIAACIFSWSLFTNYKSAKLSPQDLHILKKPF